MSGYGNSAVASGITAGAGLLGSLFTGGLNKKRATTAFHRQVHLMNYNYDLEQRALRDSVTSSLEGYRNAGLNVGAMLGNGVPQAAGGSVPTAQQAAPAESAQLVQAIQAAANIRLTNAQRENVEADTEGKSIENELNKKFGEGDRSLHQQTINSQIELNFGYLRNSNATAHNQEIINRTAGQLQEAALRKLQEEGNGQLLKNSILSQENSWYATRAQMEINEASSRVTKNAAEQAYLKAYVPLLSAMAFNQRKQGDLAGQQAELAGKDIKWYDDVKDKQFQEITARIHELYSRATQEMSDSDLKDAQRAIQEALEPYVGTKEAATIAELTSRTIMQGAATAKYGAETAEAMSNTAKNISDMMPVKQITRKVGFSQ